MTSLDFDSSYAYPDDKQILLPIQIERADGVLVPAQVILDTGASVSVFTKDLATELGITVTDGETRTIRQLDLTPVDVHLHMLTLRVLGHRLRAPVFFSDALPEGMDNLLGLIGVLDQIDIAIVHRERTLYVRAAGQG